MYTCLCMLETRVLWVSGDACISASMLLPGEFAKVALMGKSEFSFWLQ